MIFLQPAALALLGLIVPISLLYLLRMPRRQLRIPDLAVAKLIVPDGKRIQRRSRTLISYALQLAIVLCLALAASAPFLGGTLNAASKPRNVIVLLDVSASMRADDSAKFRALDDTELPPAPGPTRFSKALDVVRGMARGLGVADRMMLIAVGRTAHVVFNFESDPSVIERALNGLSPRAETAKFLDACWLAAATAKSLSDCDVVLVTDGAIETSDLSPLSGLEQSPGERHVSFVQVGQNAGNLGIVSFHARKNLDSPTDYQALVTLFNTFDESRKIEVQLLVDGSINEIEPVEIPGHGEVSHVFNKKLHVGAILEARIRVVDALADDNVAYEVLLANRRTRVLLVSENTSETSFLVKAISSDSARVEGLAITPAQFKAMLAASPDAPERLADQRDAVIFDRWTPEDPKQIPPVHLLCIGCVPPTLPVTRAKQIDQPLIRKWDRGHPLMSYLDLRNVFINKADVLQAREQELKNATPLANVAELVSSPLIVAWEHEVSAAAKPGEAPPQHGRLQRIVCIGFDVMNSDIACHKELPILLYNTIAWFDTANDPPTQTEAGAPIRLKLNNPKGAKICSIAGPQGPAESVPIDAEDGSVLFGNTAWQGVYNYSAGDEQGSFAVNIGSRRESDVRPAAELPSYVKRVEPAEVASGHAAGRRLWPWLLWAGLGLLAFETVVFHRRIYF